MVVVAACPSAAEPVDCRPGLLLRTPEGPVGLTGSVAGVSGGEHVVAVGTWSVQGHMLDVAAAEVLPFAPYAYCGPPPEGAGAGGGAAPATGSATAGSGTAPSGTVATGIVVSGSGASAGGTAGGGMPSIPCVAATTPAVR